MAATPLTAFMVDARLAGLPKWLIAGKPKVKELKHDVRLSWHCTSPARTDVLCRVTYYHGSRQPSDAEVAAAFREKVAAKHPQCGPVGLAAEKEDRWLMSALKEVPVAKDAV